MKFTRREKKGLVLAIALIAASVVARELGQKAASVFMEEVCFNG